MSDLLWSYEELGRFSSEAREFRLVVMPSGVRAIFRYLVLKQMPGPSSYLPIASGHCDTVGEAMERAERELLRMMTVH